MRNLTWLTFISLALAIPCLLPAEESGGHETITITGECSVRGSGRLYVFLVDATHFGEPLKGNRVFTEEVHARLGELEEVPFSFQVPGGRYGLRCFLDTNANGELDRGLFGPAEPWGMSWRDARPRGFPRFSDISFSAYSDYRCPPIRVE